MSSLLIPITKEEYEKDVLPLLKIYCFAPILIEENYNFVYFNLSTRLYTNFKNKPTFKNVLEIPYNIDLVQALLNIDRSRRGQLWKFIGNTYECFINGNLYKNRLPNITDDLAFIDEQGEKNGFSSLNPDKFVKATVEEIIEYYTKSKIKIEITSEIMSEKLKKIQELVEKNHE